MGSRVLLCCLVALAAADAGVARIRAPIDLQGHLSARFQELPNPVLDDNVDVFRVRRQLSRIINGETATAGEFPHQATLLLDGSHICGASIIANGWALTAGHCVDGMRVSALSVVTDLHDFNNPGNYQWFDIESIVLHGSYNQGSGTYPNDIALLKLYLDGRDISSKAITIASGSNTFAGERCTISGWGLTESDSIPSSILKKATVTVLSEEECIAIWGPDGGDILASHVCAVGQDTVQGTGTCNGDSGGPLVCNGLLVGATSFGVSGCHTNGRVTHPSVFTRVSEFYSWIRSNCNYCV